MGLGRIVVAASSGQLGGWLRELGVGFCNIDQPKSSTAITGTRIVTGPIAYVRFHGTGGTYDNRAWTVTPIPAASASMPSIR